MASDNPEFKKYGKLSLQYLVAAYGAEKLADAGKAEPILQHMIELEPADPANYFMLARLYDDAGEPAEAERMYIAAKDARPNDPAVYMSLAAHYNQLGQFDKTIDALEQRAIEGTRQPRGLPDDRELLLGQSEQGFETKGKREARLRPQGHRVGRSSAADQAGLRGGHGLQGPAPAAPGEPRKGRRQAAGADQGSGQPPRPGRGNPQEEGRRGRNSRPPRYGRLDSGRRTNCPTAFFFVRVTYATIKLPAASRKPPTSSGESAMNRERQIADRLRDASVMMLSFRYTFD